MPRLGVLEHPTSWAGVHALETAQKLGISVILFTTEPTKYEGVPVEQVVPFRSEGAEDLVRVVGASRLDGFTSFSDYHYEEAASIRGFLGMSGLSIHAARVCARKDELRRVLSSDPLAVKFRIVDRESELASSALELGFPLVAKPTNEGGSVGVYLASSPADLIAAFRTIRGLRTEAQGDPTQPVLLEEFVEGRECSIESLTIGGVTHVYGITDKTFLSGDSFIEAAHTFPASITQSEGESLERALRNIFQQIGFNEGPCHSEFKVTPQGPRLIEINARQPGGYIPTLIEQVSGSNPYIDAIFAAVGQSAPVFKPTAIAASWRKVFAPATGLLQEVIGEDLAAAAPGVNLAHVTSKIGSRVRRPASNFDAIGAVLASGPTAEEALGRSTIAARNIVAKVAVES